MTKIPAPTSVKVQASGSIVESYADYKDAKARMQELIDEHRELDVHECDWRTPDAPCDIHDEEDAR